MILDTTFFIDLYRGDSGALELWNRIFSGDETGAISPITAFELWAGRTMSQGEEEFHEGVIFYLEEMPLSVAAAKQAGQWLRGLPAATERIVRDALIAATANEHNEGVCTRNERDFLRFPVPVQTY